MNDFGLWMSREIDKRGWSRSEVARRGGISSSTIDKVINEFAKPGPKLCLALAEAFNMPDEEVFRLAGLFKRPSNRIADQRTEYRTREWSSPAADLVALYEELSPDDQALILELVARLAYRVNPRVIGEEGKEP